MEDGAMGSRQYNQGDSGVRAKESTRGRVPIRVSGADRATNLTRGLGPDLDRGDVRWADSMKVTIAVEIY